MAQTEEAFVAAQKEQWDRTSSGWGKWAELFSQRSDGAMYLELAQIRPGQRVLELGAGTGSS